MFQETVSDLSLSRSMHVILHTVVSDFCCALGRSRFPCIRSQLSYNLLLPTETAKTYTQKLSLGSYFAHGGKRNVKEDTADRETDKQAVVTRTHKKRKKRKNAYLSLGGWSTLGESRAQAQANRRTHRQTNRDRRRHRKTKRLGSR